MASKFARDRNYQEDRFEFPVSENFKCSICFNVLNNPKGCRKNQHYFCIACIRKHLGNSHTCPECMDELTPETLVDPPRVLLNCIQELRVKCGYSDRGCPEYVQLCRLQNHVDECGFAPAVCENEGCGEEVNKDEKVHHETELCKFRKVECHGCGELKKEILELRKSQEKASTSMDRRISAIMVNQKRIKEGAKEMRNSIISSLDKMKVVLDDVQSLPARNAQAFKEDVVQRTTSRHRSLTCPINHDILIMGGWTKDRKITNSVERFCCKESRWVDVAQMILPRSNASSVVLDNQIIVSGGLTDSSDKRKREPTDSIEILDLDKRPLEWKMSDAKLPVPASSHQTFLYKGNLIVICHTINKIFQVQLSPPHVVKELHTLPSLRCGFRANIVNEKVFVFGREESFSREVYVYDIGQMNVETCLPCPLLCGKWRLLSVMTKLFWSVGGGSKVGLCPIQLHMMLSCMIRKRGRLKRCLS